MAGEAVRETAVDGSRPAESAAQEPRRSQEPQRSAGIPSARTPTGSGSPASSRTPANPWILARPGRPTRRAWVLVTVGTLLSLALYGFVRHAVGVDMVDMVVYRAEGNTVRHGTDLYTMVVPKFDLVATYPPFAALMFVPTTYFPVEALRVLVTAMNLLLLGAVALFSFRLVGWPGRNVRPIAAVALVGVGIWLEPVWATLKYGQINLLIACLVLADLTRPDHARSKGLLIGIAAGLKLTPGVFGVYLLLTGRPRAALASFGGFLGTALLGWIALPNASERFWTHYLYDSHRVGVTHIPDNQSLRGALARLLHERDPGLSWAVLAAAVALIGLGTAVYATRSNRHVPRAEAWGVVCAAVTALLISPVSWTHHWVWCVPALVLLTAEAVTEQQRPRGARHLRWRLILAGGLVTFLGYGMWLTPHSPRRSIALQFWQQPISSIYAVFGLLLLGVALARAVRRNRAASAAGKIRSTEPPARPTRLTSYAAASGPHAGR
ncbi:glycosyltransferase 87 family protein [Streptacidiphilus sp. N1-12]|uniref:Glycosyltransferase 87 family protein n=2 Tax=Streptacidiphilus alkalitolerans TaxID=3342712 RepID=A0ABV6V888_9ACTN